MRLSTSTRRLTTGGLIVGLALSALGLSHPQGDPSPLIRAEIAAGKLRAPDPFTLVGDLHFVNEIATRNADGSVNVVIEIPTGTTAVWEVDEESGALKWQTRDGEPLALPYLGYPANRGMIPQTQVSADSRGTLDALVLGPAIARGAIVRTRLVGSLQVFDQGTVKDIVLAVIDGTPFGTIRDLDELHEAFPGACNIIETWFASYRGEGATKVRSWGTDETARDSLKAAGLAWVRAQRKPDEGR